MAPRKKSAGQAQLTVKGESVQVLIVNGEDYICLTDMAKNYGGSQQIPNWLRNKDTLEFLGVWESMNNPGFNSIEFDRIKNQAGSARFILSTKEWLGSTNAIGIVAKTGRYGGTYAQKDIAFEFGTWLSPEFKLLLIKDYQRLKANIAELENWDYRRFLSSVNYRLHTDSVKNVLLPQYDTPKNKTWLVYAEEADLLNMAVFGITAKDWRVSEAASINKTENIRDHATIEQLTVLANLENLNSILINDGVGKTTRFERLQKEAKRQLQALINVRTDGDKKDQKRKELNS